MSNPQVPGWVYEAAWSQDEEKRHAATRVVQGFLHALPRIVRDAILDDLEAHKAAEDG